MTLRIGIDIDGVLAEHMDERCKILRDQYGQDIKAEDMISPILEDNPIGIDADDFIRDLYGKHLSHFSRMNPIPGAKQALREFRADGHEVIIVTHRTDTTLKYTLEWLRNHSFECDEIYFDAPKDKSQIGALDLLIDDKVSNITALQNPDTEGLLFVRNYNIQLADPSMGVSSNHPKLAANLAWQWAEIIDYVYQKTLNMYP